MSELMTTGSAILDGVGDSMVESTDTWGALQAGLRGQLRGRAPEHLLDDVVQDVMEKLLQHHDQLTDATHLQRWVTSVARNRIVSEFRRAAVQNHDDADVQELQGDKAAPPEHELNAVVGRWLAEEIRHLPEPYAQALLAVDIGGMSQLDYGKQQGLSASGARTRVQRGRKQLLERLSKACTTQRDARGNFIECKPKPGCCGS